MNNYLKIMRVNQWYKNLVFFVPLIFSYNLFNTNKLALSILGFTALCLMSSVNYILNDLFDYERDKINPLKKHKPLINGSVTKRSAVTLLLILLTASLIISLFLPNNFFLFPLLLFINTSLYTVKLKNEPIIDLLQIGFNFFIRVFSNGVLINVNITNWLTLMIFTTALMLGTSKRYSSLKKLGSKAAKARPVFKHYSEGFLKSMLLIFAGMLMIIYCFYSFQSGKPQSLMLSIPFFFYIILRYLMLALDNHASSVKAELIFTDKRFLIGFLSWFAVLLIIFY